VRFVATALTMTLIIVDRQSLQFTWEVSRFALTLCVFGWLAWEGVADPTTVMIWYGLVTGITYALQLILADRATKAIALKARESEGSIL